MTDDELPDWYLWANGDVLAILDKIDPRLESWERSDHPSQIRLRAYLDDISTSIGPLPPDGPLFLRLRVDVGQDDRLYHHYDLENYLTPVVRHLGYRRFAYVSARKCVGEGSRLIAGHCVPLNGAPDPDTWGHFSCHAGKGTAEKRWKSNLRSRLADARPDPLPPGLVEVHLAWRSSSGRNWVALWKPTGDAMGPVLGEPDAGNPFNPSDDRIVELHLHRNLDDAMGHDVDVGMWWRSSLQTNVGQ